MGAAALTTATQASLRLAQLSQARYGGLFRPRMRGTGKRPVPLFDVAPERLRSCLGLQGAVARVVRQLVCGQESPALSRHVILAAARARHEEPIQFGGAGYQPSLRCHARNRTVRARKLGETRYHPTVASFSLSKVPSNAVNNMNKIYCGPATSEFSVSNDGTARATTRGLFLQANAGEISARLLEAAYMRGASGLVISVEAVAFALAPMTPQHYRYVPDALKLIPVALVANAEQAAFLQSVQSSAATAGTLRRVFRSHDDAEQWLHEQVQAMRANRLWWAMQSGHLSTFRAADQQA